MGRRSAVILGFLVVVAPACGDASVTSPATSPPAPPTTGTTVTLSPVPQSPPVEPPEWLPRWEDPVLVAEPPMGNALSGVATGPGGLVAYGEEWGAEAMIAHIAFSADGAGWEPAAAFEGVRLEAIAGGGPGYVAVGARYLPSDAHDGAPLVEPAAWWSADGRTWHEAAVDVPADTGVPATFRLADWEVRDGSWIEGVVFDGETGLAVGRSAGGARNVVWTSRDGKGWTEAPGAEPPGPAHVLEVVAGTAAYLAMGAEDPRGHDPGPAALWHSRDGAVWDQVASFDAAGRLPWRRGGVRLGSGFVVLGGHGFGDPVAWVSADGIEWSAPVALPAGDDALVVDVASNGELVVAVGSEDRPDGRAVAAVWLSADGVHWAKQTPSGDPPESTAEAVAWLDDHWLVVGRAWNLPAGQISGLVWRGR